MGGGRRSGKNQMGKWAKLSTQNSVSQLSWILQKEKEKIIFVVSARDKAYQAYL